MRKIMQKRSPSNLGRLRTRANTFICAADVRGRGLPVGLNVGKGRSIAEITVDADTLRSIAEADLGGHI